MATEDKCCTIVPYFKVHSGKLDAFKQLWEKFVKISDMDSAATLGSLAARRVAHARRPAPCGTF